MPTVAQLDVAIRANTAGLVTGLDKAAKKTKQTADKVETLGQKMQRTFGTQFGMGFGAGVGSVATQQALRAFSAGIGTITDEFQRLSRIQKEATKLDIPVEDLQTFVKLAEEYGESQDRMVDGLTDFIEKWGEGELLASGSLRDFFEDTGRSWDAFAASKTPIEAFEKLLAVYKELPNEQQRFSLLAEAGADSLRDNKLVMDALSQQGLPELRRQYEATGDVMSKELIERIREADRTQNAFFSSFKTNLAETGANVIGLIPGAGQDQAARGRLGGALTATAVATSGAGLAQTTIALLRKIAQHTSKTEQNTQANVNQATKSQTPPQMGRR